MRSRMDLVHSNFSFCRPSRSPLVSPAAFGARPSVQRTAPLWCAPPSYGCSIAIGSHIDPSALAYQVAGIDTRSAEDLSCILQVPCLIVCTSGADICEIFGGRAQLGLRMHQAQSESLCPIWQDRAQAVPLHSQVNGAQTAVVCLSIRLVQQMPSLGAQDPAPLTSRSLEHSQVLFCTEYVVLAVHVLLASAGRPPPYHGHAATLENMTRPKLLLLLCAAQECAQSVDSQESWGHTLLPFQRRTEPRYANSPSNRSAGEASQQTCHEENFGAAWAQLSRHTHHFSGQAIDVKALHKHGTLLAPHREAGGISSSYKPRAGSALWCCCCSCTQHETVTMQT